MQYCTKCVYPAASAIKLTFDENGVCSGCRVAEERKKINWREQAKLLADLTAQYKSRDGSNYDCIIPVSGGKDSYFQTHYVTKILKLKPLLVTYHGNNYLPEGEYNLRRMRQVFDVDHIIFKPSEKILIKLNRLCFKRMGDMNWHAHCGIFTYPVQIAVKFKVKLIIWGEHGYTDLGGMYSMHDFVEMTAKYRLEHALRGYDWYDMIEKTKKLTEQDLLWAKYPSEDELEETGVRGIYLGNYVNWDANVHWKLVKKLYGWREASQPFERTYRRFSNLDDMHENGIHDYLKYIKFGYGRATDHACKDIRTGQMTREEGIKMVRKYDHVKPRRDFERWLAYVSMTEKEFDKIANTFRDSRIWKKNKKSEWEKDNIWDAKQKNDDLDRISLRRAKKADLMFHYHLRSEALVRRYSFNTGTINLAGHTQWFLKKLKDSNSYSFVIKDKKKSIGQVRIDIKGDSGEISIALLPEHRNKGYAQQAIAQACRIAFKRNFKLKKIMAHIKIENVNAQKSFIKAGFADLQKTVYKGHPCIEMTLTR